MTDKVGCGELELLMLWRRAFGEEWVSLQDLPYTGGGDPADVRPEVAALERAVKRHAGGIIQLGEAFDRISRQPWVFVSMERDGFGCQPHDARWRCRLHDQPSR